MKPRFADIILPLAQPTYTFAVGEEINPQVGDAVAVQFGRQSLYTGIVCRLHNDAPTKGNAKPVVRILYPRPLVTQMQLRLWEWIAEYYMCSIGEVMRMALPSLIKPHSRTEADFVAYTPPTERVLILNSAALTEEALAKMQRRAPKRYAALCALQRVGGIARRRDVALDATSIKGLVTDGYLLCENRAAKDCAVDYSRTLSSTEGITEPMTKGVAEPLQAGATLSLPALSAVQLRALGEADAAFDEGRVVLLHGVTSSGKTEIYIHLMAQALGRGENVLYLVPEISVTTQLAARLRDVFGGRVIIYNSILSPRRRTEAYMRMLDGEGGHIVVGSRSAVMLPMGRLGLVVVDEEHDGGYRQSEPTPRYNGRDVAVMLAAMHGARTVLGSATPSIESYANCLAGKYRRVWIGERYGGSESPQVIVSDTLRAVKRGERKSHFNKILTDKIEERLAAGEQIMLFQNRLGYSPYVECPECGWTARCPHCNVTLTQHRSTGSLRCHYCGYTIPLPTHCPNCRQGEVAPRGFGTERVEDEVSKLFPQARILRLDSETLTSDTACRRIVGAFARHEADILVGTQIISKGFDFDGVTLIGILNADNLLNLPDFRAGERAWQQILQVAGRCGRRARRGEVVVQTAEPAHPILANLDELRYEEMAAGLLAERYAFSYPPYTRLIRILLRSSNAERLAAAAQSLGNALHSRFGRRATGPVAPMIDRVRGEYLLEFMLKIEVGASFARARAILREEIAQMRTRCDSRGVTVVCDVDVR